MKTILKTLFGGSLLMTLPFALNATIIVNDTFDVGATPTIGDDAGDALDVAWTGLTNASPSLGAVGSVGTGNYLFNNATNPFSAIRGALPSNGLLNLSIGDTLSLSFDFTYLTTPADSSNGFRFGLFNSSGFGTVVQAGTGDAGHTGLTIVHDTSADTNANMGSGPNGGDAFSGASDVVSAGTMSSPVATTEISVSLSITRTNATTLTLSTSVNGGLATITDVNDAGDPADYLTDFDNGYIVIRSGTPGEDFAFDNVMVTVVPEPSTIALALASLCLGFVLIRRRMRR